MWHCGFAPSKRLGNAYDIVTSLLFSKLCILFCCMVPCGIAEISSFPITMSSYFDVIFFIIRVRRKNASSRGWIWQSTHWFFWSVQGVMALAEWCLPFFWFPMLNFSLLILSELWWIWQPTTNNMFEVSCSCKYVDEIWDKSIWFARS